MGGDDGKIHDKRTSTANAREGRQLCCTDSYMYAMKSAADEAGGGISDDERECAVRAGWRLETPVVQRHLKDDQGAHPSHSFTRTSLKWFKRKNPPPILVNGHIGDCQREISAFLPRTSLEWSEVTYLPCSHTYTSK